MTHDILGNASGFEILFIVSALLGAWFSRMNLVESWRDFRALGGISNGRRAIAVSNMMTETLRLSIHALYIIAGGISVSLPTVPPSHPLSLLVMAILVYASWAITLISYISRRTRLYLLQNGLQARDSQGRFVK